jgi:hypothetical protein
MSSAGLASLVAHIAFWLLLFCGWLTKDVGPRGAVIYVFAWLAGLFLLPYVPYGAALFSPAVAILDIILVLTIFKGDVRLH